ncbi:hypothetical protein [Paraflavitalea pollutisoli]|uniref:hypothetical protein n=1 Tax=Paraflavitalea pollutisoli TaxID=3034143 RepID=UPI0023EE1A4A|nr:hypothetical protein [Paraflavitalea sp. H1-2-19X]
MAYYVRVLGTRDPDVQVDELLNALAGEGLKAQFELLQTETPSSWTVLNILNEQRIPLAQLERSAVVDGEIGQKELDEFREFINDYRPVSAVSWLQTFFDTVKVIYAFRILNAAFDDDNFEIINCLKQKLWNVTNGIIQADGEGFTNEFGYHILWQFDDDVTGEWSCAVRNAEGGWTSFVMELGNTRQRKEFMDGKVPYLARLV